MDTNYIVRSGITTHVGVITDSTDEEAVMDYAESVAKAGNAVQIDEQIWGWEVTIER